MKRILTAGLAIGMAFYLSACGNDQSGIAAIQASEAQATANLPANGQANNLTTEAGNTTDTATQGSIQKNSGKTLIAYFSQIDTVPEGADAATYATPSVGNTEAAAREIQRQVGGDLFAIKTVQAYPNMHREASEIAGEEMRSDARPELATHVANMEDYDTIYLGYPIWWYMEPMAIRTFLEQYDFSGKRVIPFCTSMGADGEESEENIAALASGAEVLPSLTIRTGRENQSEAISNWLTEIGMK